eukprot:4395055-Karenia_brevis.AAC.1
MDATCSGLSASVDRAQQWSPHDLRLELAAAMQNNDVSKIAEVQSKLNERRNDLVGSRCRSRLARGSAIQK